MVNYISRYISDPLSYLLLVYVSDPENIAHQLYLRLIYDYDGGHIHFDGDELRDTSLCWEALIEAHFKR